MRVLLTETELKAIKKAYDKKRNADLRAGNYKPRVLLTETERKAKQKAYSKKYRAENKEARREEDNARNKRWRDDNKIQHNVNARICTSFKKLGLKRILEYEDILGCSYKELEAHVSKQFTVGMSLKNYGKWHLDHILPIKEATSRNELIELCNYSNIQALWSYDNASKGYNVPELSKFPKQ